MRDKLFYVVMALAAQICIFFGWGDEHGWMGDMQLIIGGVFAGILIAELLNEGEQE
jgi:hypothetical protein